MAHAGRHHALASISHPNIIVIKPSKNRCSITVDALSSENTCMVAAVPPDLLSPFLPSGFDPGSTPPGGSPPGVLRARQGCACYVPPSCRRRGGRPGRAGPARRSAPTRRGPQPTPGGVPLFQSPRTLSESPDPLGHLRASPLAPTQPGWLPGACRGTDSMPVERRIRPGNASRWLAGTIQRPIGRPALPGHSGRPHQGARDRCRGADTHARSARFPTAYPRGRCAPVTPDLCDATPSETRGLRPIRA